MRIIDQKKHSVPMADFCTRCKICNVAQIIRACQIKSCKIFFLQHLLQPLQREAAAEKAFRLLRINPAYFHIQQCGGTEKNLMGVASCQYARFSSSSCSIQMCKVQHRTDAEGRALCRKKRLDAAKQRTCRFLTFSDDSLRCIKHIRTGDFRNIQSFRSEHSFSFMPGHVQTQDVFMRIFLHKTADRLRHASASLSARATASMMAHSIRFRKSSQPASYTPVMLPVAWNALAAQPPEQ